jgi:cysteine-rich repeat protein
MSKLRVVPLVLALVASLGARTPTHAALINFTATLDQAQETPPTGSAATGSGTFVLDTVANSLSFNITFSGVVETMAHIHQGPPGVPGAILFFLNPQGGGSPKIGVWNSISAGNMADILANNTYVNIHSAAFPGGEIRGQIVAVCSNGAIDAGETCDDGDTTSGDGCDSNCQTELCYVCAGAPSVCTPDDGASCTDNNSCTGGDICSGGACTPSSTITACIDGDGCCPPGCAQLQSDDDCPANIPASAPRGLIFLAALLALASGWALRRGWVR